MAFVTVYVIKIYVRFCLKRRLYELSKVVKFRSPAQQDDTICIVAYLLQAGSSDWAPKWLFSMIKVLHSEVTT